MTLARRSPGGPGPLTWSSLTPRDMALCFSPPFVKTLRDSGNICHVSRHVTQGLLLLVTEQIKFQFSAQKKLFLKQEVFLEKDLIGT